MNAVMPDGGNPARKFHFPFSSLTSPWFPA